MKQKVVNLIENGLQNIYGISLTDIERYIEIPSNIELGDFSLPCFTLAYFSFAIYNTYYAIYT